MMAAYEQLIERLDGRTVIVTDELCEMGMFATHNGGGMIDLHSMRDFRAVDCVTFSTDTDSHEYGSLEAAREAANQWAQEQMAETA